jgi:hypothetical protein
MFRQIRVQRRTPVSIKLAISVGMKIGFAYW